MPPPPGIQPPASDIVTLSLISHTNAGKTTLARTLLRQDVGEVRDAAHVTLFNESYKLLEHDARLLRLWDTPGFGDSARLLKRLKREKNPIFWFISQTWDRLTDKPLWCSQQALKMCVRKPTSSFTSSVPLSRLKSRPTFHQRWRSLAG